jgi:hypothetical protein
LRRENANAAGAGFAVKRMSINGGT